MQNYNLDSQIESADISEYKMKINGHKYKKWSQEQNLLYISYLEQNLDELHDPAKRKPRRFFTKMSVFLNKSRNNEQCRTHHQKMLKAHHSVLGIISHFSENEKPFVENESQNTNDCLHLPSVVSVVEKISKLPQKNIEMLLVQFCQESVKIGPISLMDSLLEEFNAQPLALLY